MARDKDKGEPYASFRARVNRRLAEHDQRLTATEKELREHNRDISLLADVCIRARRRDVLAMRKRLRRVR